MWGNLAGRLGATDINETLQKIGNAVAPPADDYEDGEYYDDEDEDGEYYDEDEADDDKPAGFGLVGMLASALDGATQRDDVEYYDDDEDDDGGEVVAFDSGGGNEVGDSDSRQPISNRLFGNHGLGGVLNSPLQPSSYDHPATKSLFATPSTDATPPRDNTVASKTLAATGNLDHDTNTTGSHMNNNHSESRRLFSEEQERQQQLLREEEERKQRQEQLLREQQILEERRRLEQGEKELMRRQKAEEEARLHRLQQEEAQRERLRLEKEEKERRLREQKLLGEQAERLRHEEQQRLMLERQEQERRLLEEKRRKEQEEEAARLQKEKDEMEQRRKRREQERMERERQEKLRLEEEQAKIRRQQEERAREETIRLEEQARIKRQQEERERLLREEHERKLEAERQRLQQQKEEEMTRIKEEREQERLMRKQQEIMVQQEREEMVQQEKLKKQQRSQLEQQAKAVSVSAPVIDKPSDTPKMTAADQQKLKELEEQCRVLQDRLHVAEGKNEMIATLQQQLEEISGKYSSGQAQLSRAENQILTLQQEISQKASETESIREEQMIHFQEKEARLMEAAAEDHQNELYRMQQEMQSQIHALEERMARERKDELMQQEKFRKLLDEAESRAEQAEKQLRNTTKQQENQIAKAQQREGRAIRMAEDKLAQTMAILDERDEEVAKLKATIKKLESSVHEHREGAEEVEEEVEELHNENEALQHHVEKLEAECTELKSKLSSLKDASEKMGGMQMELRLLTEERDRERAKSQSAVQNAMSSHTQAETERDTALLEVRDLKQQLTATLADLEIAKADASRIMTANQNLQNALESFQDERQAEMSLLDEQRKETEEALNAANEAKADATRQIHEAELKQVQNAADSAVKNAMDEIRQLENKVEKYRLESSQLRRSLDEAIHRLQTTQEDIIDRTLMKNILLDWCTMKDKNKRHQVLQLMANVLHFTEEEREKVHLTEMDIQSVRSSIVNAVAAPLPPSKADMAHLEGTNVADKFVNFLMAETDDGI